jgi:hypothetical protein
MKTKIIRTIEYTDHDGLWLMEVYDDNNIIVTRSGESMEYHLPGEIKKITQDSEYVFFKMGNNYTYQFKFEHSDFLVGDIIDGGGEHVGEFAMHVFGEDMDEDDDTSAWRVLDAEDLGMWNTDNDEDL